MATTAAGAGPRAASAAPAGVDGSGETERRGDRPSGGAFAPDRPYRLSGSVSLRPESFGALVYHFGTRRLSFLKTRPLVRVVEALADHPDVHGALAAAEVPAHQRATYLDALAGLATAGTIERRPE